MKVLGSILITAQRQRTIVDGASWDIPLSSLQAKIREGAKIGDVLWLREPFVQIKSRRYSPKQFDVLVRGASPLNLKVPEEIKPFIGDECRIIIHNARHLTRRDSLTTLEIMAVMAHAVRVKLHDKPVNDYIKEARKCV